MNSELRVKNSYKSEITKRVEGVFHKNIFNVSGFDPAEFLESFLIHVSTIR